jgi:hypothetical protein
MPFHFWPRRSKRNQLESRVRRLEKDRKRSTTAADLCNTWDDTAVANILISRIKALEAWQRDTDRGLTWMIGDIVAAERKLKKLLPDDDSFLDNRDGEDAASERPATIRTVSSAESSSSNNIGPRAATPILSPTETPVTFTRRKSNSAERVTLDTASLRLS